MAPERGLEGEEADAWGGPPVIRRPIRVDPGGPLIGDYTRIRPRGVKKCPRAQKISQGPKRSPKRFSRRFQKFSQKRCKKRLPTGLSFWPQSAPNQAREASKTPSKSLWARRLENRKAAARDQGGRKAAFLALQELFIRPPRSQAATRASRRLLGFFWI